MIKNMIERLTSVSPACSLYITDKEFMKYDEDEITERKILNDLYVLLLTDLREHGIAFSCDIADLFENDYHGELIAIIMQYLKADWVVPFISGHQELVPILHDLVEDNAVDTKVFVYLTYVHSIVEDEKLQEAMEFVSEYITSDSDFDTYLSLVLDNVNEETTSINDPELTTAFLTKIADNRIYLLDVILPRLEVYGNLINLKEVTQVCRQFGRELMIPEAINLASIYLSTSDAIRASPTFRDFVKKYRAQSKIYLEGYIPTVSAIHRTNDFTDTHMALILIGENFDVFKRTARSFEELLGLVNQYFVYQPSSEMLRIANILTKGIVAQ